jgi:UDP-N-acetylmuramate dehydrogenase
MTSQLKPGHDVPLQRLNTFGLLANARNYLRVESVDDLRAVHADPELSRLKRFVLGGGSNIVLKGDVDGLVLHMAIQGREVVLQDDEYTWCAPAPARTGMRSCSGRWRRASADSRIIR